jgi:hypothetical protein
MIDVMSNGFCVPASYSPKLMRVHFRAPRSFRLRTPRKTKKALAKFYEGRSVTRGEHARIWRFQCRRRPRYENVSDYLASIMSAVRGESSRE